MFTFCNIPILRINLLIYTKYLEFGVLSVVFGLIAVKTPLGGVLGVREVAEALVELKLVD